MASSEMNYPLVRHTDMKEEMRSEVYDVNTYYYVFTSTSQMLWLIFKASSFRSQAIEVIVSSVEKFGNKYDVAVST
jgi:hypothetical protein